MISTTATTDPLEGEAARHDHPDVAGAEDHNSVPDHDVLSVDEALCRPGGIDARGLLPGIWIWARVRSLHPMASTTLVASTSIMPSLLLEQVRRVPSVCRTIVSSRKETPSFAASS